jgi:hypothetical protein
VRVFGNRFEQCEVFVSGSDNVAVGNGMSVSQGRACFCCPLSEFTSWLTHCVQGTVGLFQFTLACPRACSCWMCRL